MIVRSGGGQRAEAKCGEQRRRLMSRGESEREVASSDEGLRVLAVKGSEKQ